MNTQFRFPNGLIAVAPEELLSAIVESKALIKAIDREIIAREHSTIPKKNLIDVKYRWDLD